MGQCKKCGNKGFFLSVNSHGLCSKCMWAIKFDYGQRRRIIDDCVKLIKESKSLKTKLHRIDLAVEHLNVIAQYESEAGSLMQPPAVELIKSFSSLKPIAISDEIKPEIEKIKSRVNALPSIKTKIKEYSKLPLKIAEWRNEYQGTGIDDLLNTEGAEAAAAIHKLQVDSFIEDADKALFMNQKTKAITKLQEALYYIKTDMIADEIQASLINDIESRIETVKNT